MKVRKTINQILLSVFCFACTNSECAQNNNEDKRFLEYLSRLEWKITEDPSKEYYSGFERDLFNSYLMVTTISGIEGQLKASDTFIYPKEWFYQDLKKWKKWYKSHKCYISSAKIDSLEKEIIQTGYILID